MINDKIIKIAAGCFIVMFVAPAVVNGGLKVMYYAAEGINKIKFNRKMKKGIKEGSIVEIDGEYYEVHIEEAN